MIFQAGNVHESASLFNLKRGEVHSRNDPEKVGRKENSGRKCREEGEMKIMLGIGRYRREGNFMAFL